MGCQGFRFVVLHGKPSEQKTICAQGTQTDFKNELLFSEFHINYSELPLMFRKVGTWNLELLYWTVSLYRLIIACNSTLIHDTTVLTLNPMENNSTT